MNAWKKTIKTISIFLLFLVGWAPGTINPGTAAEPKTAQFYIQKGRESLGKGQVDQAFADFDKAIQMSPRESNAYYARGEAYFQMGHWDQAIADFTKEIQIHPNSGYWVYYYRCLAYYKKGQMDKARADLHEAQKFGFDVDFAGKAGFKVPSDLMEAPTKRSTITREEALTELRGLGIEFNKAAFEKYVFQNNLQVAKLFLDAGMDPNSRYKGTTPMLCEISLRGNLEMLNLFLKRGANVNLIMSDTGYSPLHFAAGEGHAKIVQTLIAHGADVNAKGHEGVTPLMCASTFGRAEAVRILLASGADVHQRARGGVTALGFARLKNHDQVVQMLLAAGARETSLDILYLSLSKNQFKVYPETKVHDFVVLDYQKKYEKSRCLIRIIFKKERWHQINLMASISYPINEVKDVLYILYNSILNELKMKLTLGDKNAIFDDLWNNVQRCWAKTAKTDRPNKLPAEDYNFAVKNLPIKVFASQGNERFVNFYFPD